MHVFVYRGQQIRLREEPWWDKGVLVLPLLDGTHVWLHGMTLPVLVTPSASPAGDGHG